MITRVIYEEIIYKEWYNNDDDKVLLDATSVNGLNITILYFFD